jgi:hypothetical protein
MKSYRQKDVEQLLVKLNDQESVIRQMQYNIDEKQKFIDPIIVEVLELREVLRGLMLSVLAREAAIERYDRETVDIERPLEAARMVLEKVK